MCLFFVLCVVLCIVLWVVLVICVCFSECGLWCVFGWLCILHVLCDITCVEPLLLSVFVVSVLCVLLCAGRVWLGIGLVLYCVYCVKCVLHMFCFHFLVDCV